jgi:hypothetical protein
MASRRIERRIDDALLATATWAGFLYVRRRTRRIFSQVAIVAAAAAGVGAVVTVVVMVGAALAWKRSRTTAPPPNP